MLRLFQRNMALQGILVVAAVILLWLRPLIAPPPLDAGSHPAVLYGLLAGWLQPVPRLAVVLAMLLVLAEAVLCNLLLVDVGLASQNSLLPSLLYVLAASAGCHTLAPELLAAGIMLACLHRLMLRGTPLTIDAETICGATLMIGLATMFYQPAVCFMLSYLMVAAGYRLYTWRDWLVMLLGFAAPYVPLLAVLYLTGGVHSWWASTVQSLALPRLGFVNADPWTMIGGCVLAALLLWSLLVTVSQLGERPVLWQRNASTLLYIALGGMATLLYHHPFPLCTTLVAAPFAFAASRSLTAHFERHSVYGRAKRRAWIYDLLLVAAIIAAFLC